MIAVKATQMLRAGDLCDWCDPAQVGWHVVRVKHKEWSAMLNAGGTADKLLSDNQSDETYSPPEYNNSIPGAFLNSGIRKEGVWKI